MGNKSSKTPENKPPKNEEEEPKSSQPQHGVLSGRVSPSINIPGSQEGIHIIKPDKINSNDPERCKNCGKQYRGDKYEGFCSGECKMSAVADERRRMNRLLQERKQEAADDEAAILAFLDSDDDSDDDDEGVGKQSQGGGKTRKRNLRRKKRTKSRFKKKRGKRTRRKKRRKKSRKRKGGTISTGQPKTIVETKSNIEAKSKPSSVIAPREIEMNRGESPIIQDTWDERKLHKTERGRRCKRETRICRKFCGGRKTRKRRRKSKKKKRKSPKRRWSRKYKLSINCKKPKGFSQKQYCKGRLNRKTKRRNRKRRKKTQKRRRK